MKSNSFYLFQDGKRNGPHTRSQIEYFLERGIINHDTPCQLEGDEGERTVAFYFRAKPNYPAPSVTGLGLLSVLLALGGVAGLGYFFLFFDVSVPMYDGAVKLAGRVNNLGLMQERQNGIIVSGLALLIGVMLALFGKRSK